MYLVCQLGAKLGRARPPIGTAATPPLARVSEARRMVWSVVAAATVLGGCSCGPDEPTIPATDEAPAAAPSASIRSRADGPRTCVIAEDIDHDGTNDQSRRLVFDRRGRIVEDTTSGSVFVRQVYRYGPEGRALDMTVFDVAGEQTGVIAYTYREESPGVLRESQDLTGARGQTVAWAYEGGRVVEVHDDMGLFEPGVPDLISRCVYDPAGRPIRREARRPGHDEEMRTVVQWTWSEDGRLEEVDWPDAAHATVRYEGGELRVLQDVYEIPGEIDHISTTSPGCEELIHPTCAFWDAPPAP